MYYEKTQNTHVNFLFVDFDFVFSYLRILKRKNKNTKYVILHVLKDPEIKKIGTKKRKKRNRNNSYAK